MNAPRPREAYDLEKFFNFAVDLFCIADMKGVFRRVNPAFERVLGYSTAELESQSFLDFIHPDDREQTLAEVGKLTSGQLTLSFENRYRCKDGSYRYLHWTSYPEPKTGLLYAVARDITERRVREDRVDGITGVPNRRVWDEQLHAESRRAARLKVPVALALIDVDYLKAYNDEWGHLDGDRALRQVAQTLHGHLRRSGDLIARYRGGTFGLFLAGGLEPEQALALCTHMRDAVHDLDLHLAAGVDARLTVSAGVAVGPPTAEGSADALVVRAQTALRSAKDSGRNAVQEAP